MELKLENGDYVPDGVGGLRRVEGREELLQRVLFKLTARRGMFPFGKALGSRLWQLGRVSPAHRQSAAAQYAAEALEDEPLEVESVELRPGDGGLLAVTVNCIWQGEPLPVTMDLRQ